MLRPGGSKHIVFSGDTKGGADLAPVRGRVGKSKGVSSWL
jgi:hypothetical protein